MADSKSGCARNTQSMSDIDHSLEIQQMHDDCNLNSKNQKEDDHDFLKKIWTTL